MKRIYIYRKLVLLSVTIFTTLITSCTDFLTIIPPDKIVHEQFWQTKEDVNGMVATSYLKLASEEAISRAIVWGELRADDLTFEASKTKDDIRYIVESNITDENSFTRWGVFYEAINYANLVIEYAPLVVERDPDFTAAERDFVIGEMYALRALCHFYLVRSFRDVPMAMVPAINEGDLQEYNQIHPLNALEMIMNDLEIAENMVRRSGENSDVRHEYGRITKNAVLAIKADVNLWRAAFTIYCSKNGDANALANHDVQEFYTNCIKDCETILNNLDKQYKEDNKNGNQNDDDDFYHLISNVNEFLIGKDDTYESLAFDEIFVDENSRESIFELQLDQNLVEAEANKDGDTFRGLQYMYGAGKEFDPTPQVEVATSFMSKYEKDDLRKYSFTNTPYIEGTPAPTKLRVAKYIASNSPASQYKSKDQVDSNWIVYRQTDVMLMMAEALVVQPSVTTDDIKKSFELVNVINRRSRMDTTSISKPLSLPNTADVALELVLDERARELAFEGKRWYDLVRKALRENTTENIKFVADKLITGSASVKNKMLGIDNLFFPIHEEELRFNKLLKQNPAYDFNDTTIDMN